MYEQGYSEIITLPPLYALQVTASFFPGVPRDTAYSSAQEAARAIIHSVIQVGELGHHGS